MNSKRNYKTFDVISEAHKIYNALNRDGVATGDSVAADTVRHWAQRDGKRITVDGFNTQDAKYAFA